MSLRSWRPIHKPQATPSWPPARASDRGAERRRRRARKSWRRPPTCWSSARAHFIALLQREGGKTLDDALSEVREAVDFCRYYAAEGRKLFGAGEAMPGPTGESNVLALARPRRVRRDLAVEFSAGDLPGPGHGGADGRQYRGRQARRTDAADRGGSRSVCCMRPAYPLSALHLVQGDGRIGAALVAHPDIAGVVFTGSTEVARSINRTLAAKDGPIVPLIAETGGINAMIVDATALPEQVADDVVTSAFRSAGQRCSALRLLFVQDDVADRMIEMIAGAARELAIGDRQRSRRADRTGDRRRGQAAAGRAYRADEAAGSRAFRRHRARRQLRRAAYFRIVRRRSTDRGSVRPDPACGALPRRPARPRAAIDRTLRLRADARHSLAHRRHHRACDRPACRSATSMSTAT